MRRYLSPVIPIHHLSLPIRALLCLMCAYAIRALANSFAPGNEEILVPTSETKLILSERKSDGTVTMHYCEFDNYDHSAEEELLPTFPNTMEREGYTIQGDYLQAKPVSVVQLSDGQHKRAIGPAVIAGKPYPVQQQQQSQRQQGNMMSPGNVVGTGRNIGGGNSTVGGQGSGNVRRGAPHAGHRPARYLQNIAGFCSYSGGLRIRRLVKAFG
nr:hypothetical protein [Tanacetum cinerariifolium]